MPKIIQGRGTETEELKPSSPIQPVDITDFLDEEMLTDWAINNKDALNFTLEEHIFEFVELILGKYSGDAKAYKNLQKAINLTKKAYELINSVDCQYYLHKSYQLTNPRGFLYSNKDYSISESYKNLIDLLTNVNNTISAQFTKGRMKKSLSTQTVRTQIFIGLRLAFVYFVATGLQPTRTGGGTPNKLTPFAQFVFKVIEYLKNTYELKTIIITQNSVDDALRHTKSIREELFDSYKLSLTQFKTA